MSVQVVRDGKLWMGGYDLSGDMNAIALGAGAELKDATVLNDLSRRRRGGLKTTALTLNGFWNGGTGGVDDALFSNIGQSDVPITVGLLTGAEGERADFFKALLGEYKPGAQVGEMFAFEVTGDDSGGDGIVGGRILVNGTKTLDGNGTGYQLGAVSATQRLFAALHVTAFSGFSSAVIKVQSDDNSGFTTAADRITFTTVAGVTSEYASPVAGPITDDYWRVTWDVTGTGSISFVCPVGIQ